MWKWEMAVWKKHQAPRTKLQRNGEKPQTPISKPQRMSKRQEPSSRETEKSPKPQSPNPRECPSTKNQPPVEDEDRRWKMEDRGKTAAGGDASVRA
jgi:hypothetical protein